MRFHTLLLKNLLRRKVRSLLTLFGIAIGVGTTVALIGIADGFKRVTYESIVGRGVQLVVMERDAVDQLSSDVDQGIVELIRALPDVEAALPTLVDVAAFEVKGTTINVLMQGWEADQQLFDALEFHDGRSLQEGDKNKTVIGTILAQQLDKGVGDSVEISGEPFEIVGIYESFALPENAGLVIELSEMQRVMFNEGRITGLGVRVAEAGRNADEVKRQINELKLANGKDARLLAQSVRDYTEESMHLRVSQAMAWLTSAIAIIVGTVGVLNTMIMSVIERFREISILRAIGWRKSRIIRMILGESMILSTIGAALGIGAAFALIRWLTTLPITQGIIEGKISLQVIGLGILMAVLVGLIGGLYPALRAAGLPPCDGLRSE